MEDIRYCEYWPNILLQCKSLETKKHLFHLKRALDSSNTKLEPKYAECTTWTPATKAWHCHCKSNRCTLQTLAQTFQFKSLGWCRRYLTMGPQSLDPCRKRSCLALYESRCSDVARTSHRGDRIIHFFCARVIHGPFKNVWSSSNTFVNHISQIQCSLEITSSEGFGIHFCTPPDSLSLAWKSVMVADKFVEQKPTSFGTMNSKNCRLVQHANSLVRTAIGITHV